MSCSDVVAVVNRFRIIPIAYACERAIAVNRKVPATVTTSLQPGRFGVSKGARGE